MKKVNWNLLIVGCVVGRLVTSAYAVDYCMPSLPMAELPVFSVTDFSDSGVGTLRWALDQCVGNSGCVIEGADGNVVLTSDLVVENKGNIYINGHGMRVKGAETVFKNCDGISITDIRFIAGPTNPAGDALRIEACSSVLIRHCMIVQGTEQSLEISGDCDCVFVEYCLIGDGSDHATQNTKACRVGGSDLSGKVVMARNVFGLSRLQNPLISGNGCRVDLINNISAAFFERALMLEDAHATAPKVNVINHYNHLNETYELTLADKVMWMSSGFSTDGSVYFDGIEGYQVDPLTRWRTTSSTFVRDKLFGVRDIGKSLLEQPDPSVLRSSAWPFVFSDIEIKPTLPGIVDVYENAGARPRDEWETFFFKRAFANIITDTSSGTPGECQPEGLAIDLIESVAQHHGGNGIDALPIPIDPSDGVLNVEPRKQMASGLSQPYIRITFNKQMAVNGVDVTPAGLGTTVATANLDPTDARIVEITFNALVPDEACYVFDIGELVADDGTTLCSRCEDTTFCLCFHEADANGDGAVNALDLATIQSPLNWAKSAADAFGGSGVDLDRSGIVSAAELGLVSAPSNWLHSVSSACP
ncbi:MAG: hypothetical protein MI923_29155 [Phycisphaerales bacterium]|nr:hypothetical protein [Phycisphaerales bacterium]